MESHCRPLLFSVRLISPPLAACCLHLHVSLLTDNLTAVTNLVFLPAQSRLVIFRNYTGSSTATVYHITAVYPPLVGSVKLVLANATDLPATECVESGDNTYLWSSQTITRVSSTFVGFNPLQAQAIRSLGAVVPMDDIGGIVYAVTTPNPAFYVWLDAVPFSSNFVAFTYQYPTAVLHSGFPHSRIIWSFLDYSRIRANVGPEI